MIRLIQWQLTRYRHLHMERSPVSNKEVEGKLCISEYTKIMGYCVTKMNLKKRILPALKPYNHYNLVQII